MVEIVDNFLPSEELASLQSVVLSNYFPWYFNNNVIENFLFTDLGGGTTNDDLHQFQFTHNIISQGTISSDAIALIEPILKLLHIEEIDRVQRCKFNLNTFFNKSVQHGYHIDSNDANNRSVVFFLNSTDGSSFFKESSDRQPYAVECRENRLVKFRSTVPHSGTSPTNSKSRVVLNIVYSD